MGFVGLWWWIVAGGRSMVGFAMDWLWVGGWVGLSGGDGGGGAVWVEEREESEKIEIKMNSEKKNNK